MRYSLIPILLCGLLALSGCDQQSSEPRPKSKPPHLVEVFSTQTQAQTLERVQTGTLTAKQTVNIYNQEEGQLLSLPFHEGDRVSKNDLLVQIDGQLLEAQLQRARAIRRKAEKDLQQVRELIRRKLVAQTELTQRETELAIARADEQIIATRLGYTSIHAPIDGIISERLSEPGNIAEEHTHLLSIVDTSALLIKVTVSELFLNKLKLQMPVAIQIDALSAAGRDYPYEGSITRIHPVIDPNTRKGEIEITLQPIPQGAKPGQFARVLFRIQGDNTLLVPYASLRRSGSDEFVYTVDQDNNVQTRAVSTGLRFGEQVEILSGLEDNEQVVTRGFTNLKAGMQVTITASAQ